MTRPPTYPGFGWAPTVTAGPAFGAGGAGCGAGAGAGGGGGGAGGEETGGVGVGVWVGIGEAVGVGVGDGLGDGDAAWTGTTVCAMLSSGFGSTTAPVTHQPNRWSPATVPTTVAVTWTTAPGARVPSSHRRASAAQVPAVALSPVSRAPVGTDAVNAVPGEGAGPWLVTVMATVVEPPICIGMVAAGALSDRSTDCWTLGSFCRPGSLELTEVSRPVAKS